MGGFPVSGTGFPPMPFNLEHALRFVEIDQPEPTAVG